MFRSMQQGAGDAWCTCKSRFVNRTGATLYRGQVAMVDLLDTQSEVTAAASAQYGDENGPWFNLTPVTQASFEEGFPIVVCEDASVLDDKVGWFWLFHPRCYVAVLDDDVSTTDIDKGDRVSMVVAESAVAVQAFVTGGTGSRVVGIALEDAAADSTNTDRLINASSHGRYVWWTGGCPVLGSTDT